ncbi:helix-turn-helix domain-containing protein [Agromyces italicus]|uniref:helix-turn-helix domain-containing protein n=1 Tax=Agromyces italicus TaxID=279572 RepID=UPI0003B3E344|nr:helix-turn-helix transcriptional regulator [Agromyces italicus]
MNTDSVFPTDDAEFDAVYAEEAAMVDASELIAAALIESGMTKTELAARLGVSKSEVSARLAGERNITVRTLAATLHALGQRLELALESGVGAPEASERSIWKFSSDDARHSAPHRRGVRGWALPAGAAK